MKNEGTDDRLPPEERIILKASNTSQHTKPRIITITLSRAFEWYMENDLPDSWQVRLNEKTNSRTFTLDQVFAMQQSNPGSNIQFANTGTGGDSPQQWFVFHKSEIQGTSEVGCMHAIIIVLLPFIGLLMGLFMLSDRKQKKEAMISIVASLVLMVAYWFAWGFLSPENIKDRRMQRSPSHPVYPQ